MKKLLWIGDAGVPSGFARVTHATLEQVSQHYDVTVLGINYRGDPHSYPYPIYAALAGGDHFGIGRLIWMCDLVKPDVIVVQNDGWYFPYYFAQLRKRKPTGEYEYPEYASLPVVGSIAIDGKHFKGEWINDLSLAVFWTQFGLDEARVGGFTGRGTVIPLGVDLDTFYPVARDGALERQKAVSLRGKFIVGQVNRNQPRKRWDLTMQYFAEWVHSHNVTDAWLFLHTAPTGDESIDVLDLARYYGVLDRLALVTPEKFYGKSDDDMRDTYNCFDVAISTSQGEGFGLTTAEAMACGVPCIVPDWSGLGDWARGAAALVPCTTTALQNPMAGLNTIGGVPDKRAFIQALDTFYRDQHQREAVGKLGMMRVQESRFRWEAIGAEWVKALNSVLAAPAPQVPNEIWQELKA